MLNNTKEKIDEVIKEVLGFNDDEKICNQEAKKLVIIKLEEAKFWFDKILN